MLTKKITMPNVTITVENTESTDAQTHIRLIVYNPKTNTAPQGNTARYILQNDSAEKILNVIKEDAAVYSLQTTQQVLTQKEKQVLQLLTRGNSYKMIAKELNKSVETIRVQIKSIYRKLQVCSNTQAVIKAINEGML